MGGGEPVTVDVVGTVWGEDDNGPGRREVENASMRADSSFASGRRATTTPWISMVRTRYGSGPGTISQYRRTSWAAAPGFADAVLGRSGRSKDGNSTCSSSACTSSQTCST